MTDETYDQKISRLRAERDTAYAAAAEATTYDAYRAAVHVTDAATAALSAALKEKP